MGRHCSPEHSYTPSNLCYKYNQAARLIPSVLARGRERDLVLIYILFMW